MSRRADTYLLFARLFREAPTPELLRRCHWPGHAEAIAVEYARLFTVPGEQAVRPYESVYCDTLTIDTSTACSPYFDPEPTAGGLTGFLHGASANAVRDAYQRAGFSVEPGCHELPDHLAIELEFMGRLLERGGVDHANTFFTDHLGRPARQDDRGAGGWVFHCLDEIRHKTSSGFYRAVVDALLSFLQREQEHFSLRV